MSGEVILTKQEKVLLKQLCEYSGYDYTLTSTENDYFDGVLVEINDYMSGTKEHIDGMIGSYADAVKEHLSDIREAKRAILEEQREVAEWKKQIVKHQEMRKVVKQLEKEFAKRSKK